MAIESRRRVAAKSVMAASKPIFWDAADRFVIAGRPHVHPVNVINSMNYPSKP
jgi:hypothetical protein